MAELPEETPDGVEVSFREYLINAVTVLLIGPVLVIELFSHGELIDLLLFVLVCATLTVTGYWLGKRTVIDSGYLNPLAKSGFALLLVLLLALIALNEVGVPMSRMLALVLAVGVAGLLVQTAWIFR